MITDVGLYLHIPFCKKKCLYCDFCSVGGAREELVDSYIDKLISEIKSYKAEKRIKASTVYFGGGTPSYLSPKQMEKIMLSLGDTFDISECREISFEANPGTVSGEKLSAFRSLGFNRISIGLQSVHEKEMQALGRIHNNSDFLFTYKEARKVGFDNVSFDLMYGIPYQTEESFAQTLSFVTALSPEHISCYGLIVEEGTPFYEKRASLPLPSPDEECNMYEYATKFLSSLGYGHYEISNYAKTGFECQHNLLYWRDMEYIGLGAAAYSYYKNERFGNVSNFEEYISSHEFKKEYREKISKEAEKYEYAMLCLRLREGLPLALYRQRFGEDFICGREEFIARLVGEGLASLNQDRLSLTDKGMYVSNTILAELL